MLPDAVVIFMLSLVAYGTSPSKNNYHVPKSKKKKAARKRQKERQVEQLSSPVDLNVFNKTFKKKTPYDQEAAIIDLLITKTPGDKVNHRHLIYRCKSDMVDLFNQINNNVLPKFIIKYNEHIDKLNFFIKYRTSPFDLVKTGFFRHDHIFVPFMEFPRDIDNLKPKKCFVCAKCGTVVKYNTPGLDCVISPCGKKSITTPKTHNVDLTEYVFDLIYEKCSTIPYIAIEWFVMYGFVSRTPIKDMYYQLPIFTKHGVKVHNKTNDRKLSNFDIIQCIFKILQFIKKNKFIVPVETIKFSEDGFEMTILSKHKGFFNDDGTISPENRILHDKLCRNFAKKIAKEIRWECYCKNNISEEDLYYENSFKNADGSFSKY